ncbi:HEPN domain-containing protein [Citrobacter sp. Ce006]|uniref:MAE_28990/MAE_18760 family HEPN-like nuclease n=1 Tax=Citrobacter sp. Ce006 TaxID=2985039 RepID=UPI002577E719|nr:MAE_28990/MAE_18760 family HEPN-like nuclease [Citrobacter sp. Ce006]MDM3317844.1 HEPN domain-containing protein [Citrobacter sp. Ce006]
MNSVRRDFEIRCKISNTFLSHIEEISSANGNVEISIILKSSFYISLYNNIEATIYSILERFHEEISRHKYQDLIKDIKSKIVLYHFGNSQEMTLAKKIKLSDKITSGDYTLPQLKEFMDVKTVFSGNLNLKIIREIFKSYGLPIKKINGNPEHLLSVTTKRNKIAHGEQSLIEAGRISNKNLKAVMVSVDSILDDIIIKSGEYLNNQRFLLSASF